jgi:hypothetical protein
MRSGRVNLKRDESTPYISHRDVLCRVVWADKADKPGREA